jgi:hypothetical protein
MNNLRLTLLGNSNILTKWREISWKYFACIHGKLKTLEFGVFFCGNVMYPKLKGNSKFSLLQCVDLKIHGFFAMLNL